MSEEFYVQAEQIAQHRQLHEGHNRIVYDLPETLVSPEGVERLMEIVVFDTLDLEPSPERNQLLLEIADAMFRHLTEGR